MTLLPPFIFTPYKPFLIPFFFEFPFIEMTPRRHWRHFYPLPPLPPLLYVFIYILPLLFPLKKIIIIIIHNNNT
tara:strand:+ start:220 stop:441 length:222 start_codon:yes stop_codon:yes gene_type:complete